MQKKRSCGKLLVRVLCTVYIFIYIAWIVIATTASSSNYHQHQHDTHSSGTSCTSSPSALISRMLCPTLFHVTAELASHLTPCMPSLANIMPLFQSPNDYIIYIYRFNFSLYNEEG